MTLRLLRSDLRRRWRSWLALVVLAGLVGGLSMAAVAGWRRTSTAMDRFVAYHEPANAYTETSLSPEELEAIEGVEEAIGGDYFLLVPVDAEGVPHPEQLGQVSPFSFASDGMFRTTGKPIVVDGELYDPDVETEVMVDEEMAELYDLEPGDTLTMQAYRPEQAEQLFGALGSLMPAGQIFDFEVTGIVRAPEDVVPPPKVPDVVYLGSASIALGTAFDEAHRRVDVPSIGAMFPIGGAPGSDGYELRVDFDQTTPAEVEEAIRALDPDPEVFVDFSGNDAIRARTEAMRSIRLQATLLLALGVLIAVGGLVLLAQGLRRQLEVDRASQRSLAALGATRRDALRLAQVKGTLYAGASVALAVPFAIAVSPLSPVGHARRAEIDPGVSVDALVLLVGSLLLATVLIAFLMLSASREAAAARSLVRRSTPTSSALSDRAGRWGMSPPVVAGVRAAVLGGGMATVAITVFVAAAGIVGALTFVASEDELANDPELWGWTYDAVVGDGNDDTVGERAAPLIDDPMIESLAGRREIESLALSAGDDEVEADATALVDLRGHIEPRMLEGDAPRRPDEIALGGVTARRLGVEVGDEVSAAGPEGEVPFTVTGIVVMSLGFNADRIGEGAVLSSEGADRVGGDEAPVFVLVDYADGVDPDDGYEALHDIFGNTVLRPTRAIDVQQLHDVRYLPVWFSALLAAVAVATLAFVLVVTIRRRRHDLALLRALGFSGRDVRTTVLVQALTLAIPAAVLGSVVGVAAGRVVWSLTAEGLGAPEVHVTPFLTLAAVVGGTVLLAWIVSAVPGRLAGRVPAAAVLRAE